MVTVLTGPAALKMPASVIWITRMLWVMLGVSVKSTPKVPSGLTAKIAPTSLASNKPFMFKSSNTRTLATPALASATPVKVRPADLVVMPSVLDAPVSSSASMTKVIGLGTTLEATMVNAIGALITLTLPARST